MKKNVSFLILIYCFTFCLFAQKTEKSVEIKLKGTWTYSFSNGNKSCKISGDKISNEGKIDSAFKLIFFLSTNKYSGGNISGYKVGSKSYDTLKSNYSYTKIDTSFSDFSKKQPPDGDYYPVILLTVQKNQEYGIVNYLCFDKPIHFHNTIVDEANKLLEELDESQKMEKYWSNRVTDIYSTNTALEWIYNTYTIKDKLIDLGYDFYGKGINNLYSGTEKILDLANIKENTINSTNNNTYISPRVTDYYLPDYSYIYDYSYNPYSNPYTYDYSYMYDYSYNPYGNPYTYDYSYNLYDYSYSNNSTSSGNSAYEERYRRQYEEALADIEKYERKKQEDLAKNDMSSYNWDNRFIQQAKERAQNALNALNNLK